VKRFESESVMVAREVLAEATCDRCGWSTRYASELITVVISVHEGEEGGAVDECDYCDDCIVELAPVLVAAGSKAEMVTGEPA
jgi:hypothetical protein